MKKILFNKSGGFTLIELLVVIAIVSLLASVILASLGSARTRAKDAARVETFLQIRTALELYYDTNGYFPTCNGDGWCDIPPYDGGYTSLDLTPFLDLSNAQMGGEPLSHDWVYTDNASGKYYLYFSPANASFKKNVGCGAALSGVYCLGNY